MAHLTALLALVSLPLAAVDIHPARAAWPCQTYRTVDFTPPRLQISPPIKTTDDAFLFIAPDGPTAYQKAPVILNMTDGELIWNGPETHAYNFGVYQLNGSDVRSFLPR
jgi:hypothetical protein